MRLYTSKTLRASVDWGQGSGTAPGVVAAVFFGNVKVKHGNTAMCTRCWTTRDRSWSTQNERKQEMTKTGDVLGFLEDPKSERSLTNNFRRQCGKDVGN